MQYAIIAGNTDGAFAIDANTGVVTVADGSLLDYEAATSHTVTVKATSSDGSTSTQSFTINLADADEADVGAIADNDAGANSVAENAANGTAVGITASASDAYNATATTEIYTLSLHDALPISLVGLRKPVNSEITVCRSIIVKPATEGPP